MSIGNLADAVPFQIVWQMRKRQRQFRHGQITFTNDISQAARRRRCDRNGGSHSLQKRAAAHRRSPVKLSGPTGCRYGWPDTPFQTIQKDTGRQYQQDGKCQEECKEPAYGHQCPCVKHGQPDAPRPIGKGAAVQIQFPRSQSTAA